MISEVNYSSAVFFGQLEFWFDCPSCNQNIELFSPIDAIGVVECPECKAILQFLEYDQVAESGTMSVKHLNSKEKVLEPTNNIA